MKKIFKLSLRLLIITLFFAVISGCAHNSDSASSDNTDYTGNYIGTAVDKVNGQSVYNIFVEITRFSSQLEPECNWEISINFHVQDGYSAPINYPSGGWNRIPVTINNSKFDKASMKGSLSADLEQFTFTRTFIEPWYSTPYPALTGTLNKTSLTYPNF